MGSALKIPNISLSHRHFHVSSSTMVGGVSSASENVLAATSFEQLMLFFSPSQLGVQLLETVHTSSGLPWWASIPLTAAVLKTALLPLSAKARASGANLALIQEAVDQSKLVTLEMSSDEIKTIGRYNLVKKIFGYLKSQHQVPSFRWFFFNAAVQVPIFVTLTMSLRRMSENLWPGLVDQGFLIFRDLTPPPLYLDTMSTPFGTAGAIFPLAISLMYARCVDLSASGRSAAISAALKLLLVPGYCISLLQPHAVLFYWISHTAVTAVHYQSFLSKSNALTKFAKVPAFILQPSEAPVEEAKGTNEVKNEGEEKGSDGAIEAAVVVDEKDAKLLDKAERLKAMHAWEEEERKRVSKELEGLLLHLADDFATVNNVPAARACLRRLLIDQPQHAGALQQWENIKQRMNTASDSA